MEKTLHEIFPNDWSAEAPKNLNDLVDADYDSLDDKSKTLRALAINLVQRFEREPIHTPMVAKKMLEDHHLPVRRNKWVAVVLDSSKEKNFVRAEGGAMRLNHSVSTNPFESKKLSSKAVLPENGKYLIIYGGSPSILNDPGVADNLATLREEVPVADILFWYADSAVSEFYSVGAGVGMSGSTEISFPDPVMLEKVRAA